MRGTRTTDLGSLAALVALVATAPALTASRARAGELLYAKYLTLDEAEKEKLVRRYVRKDREGFWLVAVSKYEVRTKTSPEFSLRMAFLMDGFHAKFSAIFSGRFLTKQRPKLCVLPDKAAYQAYIRAKGTDPGFSSGMYMSGPKLLITYKTKSERSLQNILFHEGTHQLLHAYTARHRLPPWFGEGLATNFETWDLELSAPGNVKQSTVASYRRRVVVKAMKEGKDLSLGPLLALTGMTWRDAKDYGLNYARAWSLVNYLLSTKRGQANFNVILATIYRGRDLNKLLTPQTRKQLEKLWHEDLKTRQTYYDEFAYPALGLAARGRVDKAIELASKGVEKHAALPDARFWRGKVLCRAGRYEEALTDLRSAEAKDKGFPRLYALLGKACSETGDRAKAAVYLRKAVARNPADAESAALLKKAK